jgi:hypothetical protein
VGEAVVMSQSYEPTFFLLKRRLPASESAKILGRVVRRYEDPTLSYTPESPSQCLTEQTFKTFLLGTQFDTDAHLKTQASRKDGLLVALSGLLSVSNSAAHGGSTVVESPCITTRRLKREEDYFNTLKAVPQVRRKLLEMCPVGDKMYLVVGTMSVQRARFNRTDSQSKSIGVSGSLPLGIAASAAALAAGGVVLPLDSLPDPAAETKHSNSTHTSTAFSSVAVGDDGDLEDAEEVFAVACKEITRSWRGLGQDLKLKPRHPEYRGGQHFGQGDDETSDDEDDMDEEIEAMAAEGLELLEREPTSLDGRWISNPWRSTTV